MYINGNVSGNAKQLRTISSMTYEQIGRIGGKRVTLITSIRSYANNN